MAEKSFLEQKDKAQTEVSSANIGPYPAEEISYTTADNQVREYLFTAEDKIFVIGVYSPVYQDQTPYLPLVEPMLASFKLL